MTAAPPLSPPSGTRDLLPLELRLRAAIEERLARVLARAGYAEVALPLLEQAATPDLAGLARDGRFHVQDRQGHRLWLRGSLLPGLVLLLLQHHCHHQGLTRLRAAGPVCGEGAGATQGQAVAWLHSAPPSPAVVAEALVLAAEMARAHVSALALDLVAGGCPRCPPPGEGGGGDDAVPAAAVLDADDVPALCLCSSCTLFAQELSALVVACDLAPRWHRLAAPGAAFGYRLRREGAGGRAAALASGWQLWRNHRFAWLPEAGCMLNELTVEPLVEEARRALDPPGPPPALQAYVVWTEAACLRAAFLLTQRLRQAGVSVAMSLSDRSLRSQLRQAQRQSARFVLFLDREHLAAGKVQLREAISHWSESRPLDDLRGIRRRIEAAPEPRER